MKHLKRIVLGVFLVALGYGISYLWRALPIISGFGAKDLCSCVLVNGRKADDVIKQELGTGLLSVGSFSVNMSDSSATGSVFGLAKRKAIYRKGLGCTLVVEMTEDELRKQPATIYSAKHISTDTIPWPMGDRTNDSLPAGIDQQKLTSAVDFAFDDPTHVINTRAVLVVYNGKIVAERYAKGYDKNSRHMGWSMTKSINNAVVGILTKQGKLNLQAPAPVEGWAADDRKQITLHNLMQASSGLKWEEYYAGPSGATNMLFKKKDMGLYAADVPLEFPPNTVFEYSSGTTNIIARIIRNAIGDQDYYQFYYKELFEKIGAHSMIIEPDAGGTYVGSSYSWATARDWARFGLLFLNDGMAQGERILPEGWVTYSSTPATTAPRGEYGAQWWLNAGEKGNPKNRTYPDVPADSFQAEGYEGQFVFVVPSKKLVVVKLGLCQKGWLDMNTFVSKVVSALPQ